MGIREQLQALSEDKLRIKIVIPLLRALGCTYVKNHHGRTEKGKDIIYQFKHPILCRELYGAVVMKNNGKVSKKDQCEIERQIKEATRGYINIENPLSSIRIHELIFLSAYDLTEDMINYFYENCGITCPNLHFILGSELERLIQTIMDKLIRLSEKHHKFSIDNFKNICVQLEEHPYYRDLLESNTQKSYEGEAIEN